jgi:23S rRNA (cytosine1962-C5)-methyltransferase
MGAISKIYLKKDKDVAVNRFHPWIFSGAIDHIEGDVSDGDLVKVFSSHKEFLVVGHYSPGSIAVRILSYKDITFGAKEIHHAILDAYLIRVKLGLVNDTKTNVYRLVFGEGDHLPGLIIDIYNKTAVIQTHTTGMYRFLDEIRDALVKIYGKALEGIYFKGSETLKGVKGVQNKYLIGSSKEVTCMENGLKFHVDVEQGQKTGLFIDQRVNRNLIARFACNSRVLNLFAYNGAFSIFAIRYGASLVHSVDSSAKACEWANKNILLNDQVKCQHQVICEDALDYLNKTKEKYDMMIIDPPAFAKHLSSRHNAISAYKRLNAEAIKKIESGGIIFTFSCSQVVDRNLFNSAILSAAIESGRKVRILQQLNQAPDHPANIYFPEGEYLKGLILHVD